MPSKPIDRILKEIKQKGDKYVPKVEAWSAERRAAVLGAEGEALEQLQTVPAIKAFLLNNQEFATT